MNRTTKKYNSFNDAPLDEQEMIMQEVYRKLKNRSFISMIFSSFLFIIIEYLILSALVTYIIITTQDISCLFYYFVLSICLFTGHNLRIFKNIKTHFIDVYHFGSTDKFKELVNKIPLTQYEQTVYSSYPYKIIRGKSRLPQINNRFHLDYEYIRVLYSDDEIIKLLNNYARTNKIATYKNSLSRLSTSKYLEINKLIKEEKFVEVHELLEDMTR